MEMLLAKNVLKSELDYFEDYFQKAVKSKVSLLDTIMRYVVKRKGKQLRPLFVLLSAKLIAPPNEKTYRVASLVELLHTATLVHDDVVDDSHKRRGFFSINALWKNKIAVLVGDYLLSKGLLLSLENKDFDTLTYLSRAVKEMSEGELLQLEKSRKLNITEEEYYSIINGKTASLLSSACATGLMSVTDNQLLIDKMATIGTKIGLAFQIRDDLFDFGLTDIGKPLGNDLQEKKLTLPIIFALSQADKTTQKKIKSIISKRKLDKSVKKNILQFVQDFGGLTYAENKMQSLKTEALVLLQEFPDSEVRNAFADLIEFVIKRNK